MPNEKLEKEQYEIIMSLESVIEILKRNKPDTNDCIKTLETVGIITEGIMKGKVLFRGEQYPIIDGKVIKD